MGECLDYIGDLEEGKCVMVSEASSSKTAFTSYNHKLEINPIDGKLTLKLSNKEMHEYSNANDSEGYYKDVLFNVDVRNHILESDCEQFFWGIFATGGMRNHAVKSEESFYEGIKNQFNDNRELCLDDNCKDITLVRLETLDGTEEARFAWNTFKQLIGSEDHAIMDIGGETGQFADKDETYSDDLGFNRAQLSFLSRRVDEDGLVEKSNYVMRSCRSNENNNPSSIQYDGEQCRGNITIYLKDEIVIPIPNKNPSDYSEIYSMGFLYNIFYSFCTYNKYITDNHLSNSTVIGELDGLCESMNNAQPIVLGVKGYKEISDTVCQFWNDEWGENNEPFMEMACLGGNYDYQVLRSLGLSDNAKIKAFPGDKASVYDQTWILGAAVDMEENCNPADHLSPGNLLTGLMAVGSFLVFEGLLG
jgi:hypothetical protein